MCFHANLSVARTWVAVQQDSPVVCTHCTCMAGLGGLAYT